MHPRGNVRKLSHPSINNKKVVIKCIKLFNNLLENDFWLLVLMTLDVNLPELFWLDLASSLIYVLFLVSGLHVAEAKAVL